MGSRVVACRLAEDLYEEFETLCNQEGLSPSEKLKKLVDNCLYPPREVASAIAQPKETEPEQKESETVLGRLHACRCPTCGGYLQPRYLFDREKNDVVLYAYACPVCLISTRYYRIPKVDTAKDGKQGYYDRAGSFHEYDILFESKWKEDEVWPKPHDDQDEDDGAQKYRDDGGIF